MSASAPAAPPQAAADFSGGGTVLAFLNEVAGGRRLVQTIRERVAAGADRVALIAPQNRPAVGQIVDAGELRDAARSRVEVTAAVLAEFGVASQAAVFDPDPALALDDAIRAFYPGEVLVSCLLETRIGLKRRDLVEWARERSAVPVTHIPVRIADDAVSWNVNHTLVVATRTVASPELLRELKSRAAKRRHRYTIVSPASGELSRDQACARLASTLAELYRDEIDATGQPMGSDPLAAVRDALARYRIDDVLVSTLKGADSPWVSRGLIDLLSQSAGKPVKHLKASDEWTGGKPRRGRAAGAKPRRTRAAGGRS